MDVRCESRSDKRSSAEVATAKDKKYLPAKKLRKRHSKDSLGGLFAHKRPLSGDDKPLLEPRPLVAAPEQLCNEVLFQSTPELASVQTPCSEDGEINPRLLANPQVGDLSRWELERLYLYNLALLEQQRRYTKMLEKRLGHLKDSPSIVTASPSSPSVTSSANNSEWRTELLRKLREQYMSEQKGDSNRWKQDGKAGMDVRCDLKPQLHPELTNLPSFQSLDMPHAFLRHQTESPSIDNGGAIQYYPLDKNTSVTDTHTVNPANPTQTPLGDPQMDTRDHPSDT